MQPSLYYKGEMKKETCISIDKSSGMTTVGGITSPSDTCTYLFITCESAPLEIGSDAILYKTHRK